MPCEIGAEHHLCTLEILNLFQIFVFL